MLYQRKNPHGGDIYGGGITLDFSANTNPLGTPPGVLQAIEEALPQLHRYPDPYCRTLVDAIARHEGLPQDFILCGSGAAELIYGFCQAAAPRKAAELAPTFSEYTLGLQGRCQMVRYGLHQENNFDLGWDFLDFLEREQPQALFLCTPNNPTGRLIDPELLTAILQLCRSLGTRVLLDECFLDLSQGGRSMKDQLSQFPNLLILRAFTKSYGMAGVRLGYCLCADPAFLEAISQTTQPWNVSTLAQAAGVAALQEREFLDTTRGLIFEQREWLKQQLEALGFWVCPSRANYLLFRGQPGLDTALRSRGIAIRSCGNYVGLDGHWYRIAVKLPEENRQLLAAIAALERNCHG